VLLYSGCAVAEVIGIATRLHQSDVDVNFVSPGGTEIVDASGLRLVPDLAVEAVNSAMLDAVLVPGGDPGSIAGNPHVRGLLRSVASADGVVAGICAGVIVLADAGLVGERHITHNYRAPWASVEIEHFVSDLLLGAEVEPVDGAITCIDPGSTTSPGTIITALPNAVAEFTGAVGHALGIFGQDQVELVERHLKGELIPALFDQRQ